LASDIGGTATSCGHCAAIGVFFVGVVVGNRRRRCSRAGRTRARKCRIDGRNNAAAFKTRDAIGQ
jgi:hypothetical protein